MPVTTVEYLLANGERYRIARNQFTRFKLPVETDQITAKRTQAPFVDAEVIGFESGEGLLSLDDAAAGIRSARGLEPAASLTQVQQHGGHLSLKVGRQLSSVVTATGSGGFLDAFATPGYIYLLSASETKVYRWDGMTLTSSSWSAITSSLATDGTRLAWLNGLLYFGAGGKILSYNPSGGTFVDRGSVTSYSFQAMVIGAYYGGSSGGVLWVGAQDGTNCVAATTDASGTGAYTYTVRATFKRGSYRLRGAIVGSTVYFSNALELIGSNEASGLLSSLSADGSGGATQLMVIQGNFPIRMLAWQGTLVLGMAWGGSVRVLNGSDLEEILHFGSLTAAVTPASDAVWAMCTFDSDLYVASYDTTAASGETLEIRRYTGSGWHTVAYGGHTGSTSAPKMLVPWGQTLYLSDSQTDARLFKLSTSDRLTAAELELPNAIYGAPGIQFRYRRVYLRHSALVAGQAVQVRYRLDDGSETTVGTNRDVGSTETAYELGDDVRGSRLRPIFYLTNVAASDLTIYGAGVRALPAPEAREVWEADLYLRPRTNWASDAAADTDDALTKLARLEALQLQGTPFQVVDPFRDTDGVPKRALRAVFDPAVPLEMKVTELAGDVEISLPVRLLQASEPENLLKNASFEQDAAGAAPTDWSTTGTGTSSNVSTAVPAPDGSKVLAIVFNGAAASYGRTQSVAGLTPGRYYTLSAYVRRASTAGTFALNVFESGVIDESGSTLAAATDSAFTRYSQTFQLPDTSSGTISVRLIGQSTPAGTVYVDAPQLEEGAPASDFREGGSGVVALVGNGDIVVL